MSTRLYFSNGRRASVAPVFSGAWAQTTQATRFMASPSKDGVTPTVGTTISVAASQAGTLDRQYITAGLNGDQTISGRISGQLMVREFATTDNVDRVIVNARVVSNDGGTIRGTLLNHGIYGPTLEFINNASLRNKTIVSGTAVVNVNTINAQDGDRIVMEIGYSSSVGGTTPEAAAGWGGGAFSSPDLPVNETQNTTAAGWWDFRDIDLSFKQTQFVEMSEDSTI